MARSPAAAVVAVLALLQACRGQADDRSVAFTVSEGLPPGTAVGSIATRAGLRYKFSDPPTLFHLDDVTGAITTRAVIDRERLTDDVFDLFVQSVPSGQHLVEVRITVLDVNDNHPTFERPEITVSFSENDKSGTQVILDTATDADIGVNDVTNDYLFVSGNSQNRFRLVVLTDTATPLLYLENNETLDREETASYQLNISARDGGSPPKYGFLIVNIEIRDINDNPPLFDQSDYSVSIKETFPLHTSIMTVHATDIDTPANADITYSVINDDYAQFAVGAKSGVVTALKPLYCHRPCAIGAMTCHPDSCFVTLEARDNGHPFPLSGRAYLTVNLLDENNHAPTITFQYYPRGVGHATVDEGAELNAIVAVVSVTDPDRGVNGETSARIVGGNEAGHFKMATSQGFTTIRVASRLDRERRATYNLTVEARDGGTPPRSATAVLLVHVNDINDHRPTFLFPSQRVVLGEMTLVGSYVATVRATDGDSGENARLRYSVAAGDRHGWLHIDPTSGLVTTRAPLDYELERSLEVKIAVQDGAARPLTAFANLTVVILDENDETPTFQRDVYDVTVAEDDRRVPTHVVTVNAVDRDSGRNGSVRYELDPDVEVQYRGMFTVDGVTGVVTARRPVDREEWDRFTLTVWARDMAVTPRSSSVVVSIRVTDVNDNAPVFYPLQYHARVAEYQTDVTSVVCVTATDPDSGDNGTVRYAFAKSVSGPSVAMFSVDDVGCVSTRGRRFQRDVRSLYVLHVIATDLPGRRGRLPAVVEVTVQADASPPPAFTRRDGYSFTVAEDGVGTAVGRWIGTVSAVRTDGRLTYAVVAGDPDSVFQIDSASGRIITAKSVDREERSHYVLTVVASGGSSYAETRVNVTVTDVNDNAPTFATTDVRVTVSETVAVGDRLLHALATDTDDGDNAMVTYSLVTPSADVSLDRHSGVITLARSLRGEAGRRFDLTVIAKDAGSPSLSSRVTVTVTIQDANIHTPRFNRDSYRVNLNEMVAVGHRFQHVVATDDDLGSNGEIRYKLVGGNEAGKFAIFPDGVLYAAGSLDREAQDEYVLTVRGEDGGSPSRYGDVSVTVDVTDANDNAPRFTADKYEFTVMEGEPAFSYVGRVTAVDADSDANGDVRYLMDDTDFSVDAATGAVMTSGELDREERALFSFVVTATDRGREAHRATCVVVVRVADRNDHAPRFTEQFYRRSVAEDAVVGTAVLTASAVDADVGANAQITYRIVDGNDDGKFKLDGATGRLEVAGPLDRELIATYFLTVMAVDGGQPVQNATAHVTVAVLDVNDNAPTFHDGDVTTAVAEDVRPGDVVYTVTAIDADAGDNATVAYRLTHAMFSVDVATGDVYLSHALDYEATRGYVLTVMATDLGSPPRSASCTVVVNVTDVNDNAPRFDARPVVTEVMENTVTGTSLTTLTASDRDAGVNGRVTYRLVSQRPATTPVAFSIDAVTGVVRTAAPLDREKIDQYRLLVAAVDTAVGTRRSATKLVTVAVGDVNDNAPVFTSPSAVAVPTDVTVGGLVATVRATDADVGVNAIIRYAVTGGESDMVRVNATSGALYLRKPLSRRAHVVTLSARDGGVLITFHHLAIFPVASDNALQFASSHYAATVRENAPASTSLVTVALTGSPGVTYHLTGVTAGGVAQPRYFQVHASSGIVTTTQPMDFERGYAVFLLQLFAVETTQDDIHTRSTLVSNTQTIMRTSYLDCMFIYLVFDI